MKFRKEKYKTAFLLHSLLLIFVFFSASCSKKFLSKTAYDTLKKKVTNDIVTSIPEAKLDIDKDYRFKLKSNDSVSVFGDSIKYHSYYNSFNSSLVGKSKYRIIISSLCNCLGFKKYMFTPVISIINNGKINNLIAETYNFDYSHGPLSININYVIDTEFGGDYKIVVFSDNRDLGTLVHKSSTILFAAPIFIPLNHNIKSTFIGKYYIKIEKIK